MPANASFLLQLGIIAGSALAFSVVVWRLHMPIALGQLIAGMVIGPFGLKLVTDLTSIQQMAEVGIVLLLFMVGLELDPFELRAIGTKVLSFTSIEFATSFLIGAFAAILLGWGPVESLVLAGILSISSTALVAKILYERRTLSASSAGLMMGALVVEDLIAVFMLSLLPNLEIARFPSLAIFTGWLARGGTLVVLVLVVGVYISPRVIDRISQLDVDVDEAGFLLSLSLAFVLAILASLLGFSAATGAFLMGLVIRGKRARFVYSKTRPVHDLFLTIFFVSMGMLIDFSQLLNWATVLVIFPAAFVGKYIGSYAGAVLASHRNQARDIAVDMNPRGEFSFVLAREASSVGVVRSAIYSIAGTTVMLTTLLAALITIARNAQKAYRKPARRVSH